MWQIRVVRTLWCDIDDTSNPCEVLTRCESAGLPHPSIVVHSGHGLHVFWLLDTPYLIDDVDTPPAVHTEFIDGENGKRKAVKFLLDPQTNEKLSIDARQNVPPLSTKAQHIRDIVAGIASKIGGDSVCDLPRLLRLPGSLNRKDERNGREPAPCRVVECDRNRRYSIGDFEQFAEAAPTRMQREKIGRINLPAPRRLTASKQNKFDELVIICDAADVGVRSEADFSLCCYGVEHGMLPEAVWAAVQSSGKFSEGGERYFHRTWAAAELHTRERIFENARAKAASPKATRVPDTGATSAISNAGVYGSGSDTKVVPKAMAVVIESILESTDDWPRQVNGALFTHDPNHGICWLPRSPALFGWLARRHGTVDWRRDSGCVSKEEVFAELQLTTQAYESIEMLPHEPRVAGCCYSCEFPAPSSGESLDRLLDFFAPATDLDRQLLQAAFVTPTWGGPPGARPAFMFTCPQGRGKGKSKLAQMIGSLYGASLMYPATKILANSKAGYFPRRPRPVVFHFWITSRPHVFHGVSLSRSSRPT